LICINLIRNSIVFLHADAPFKPSRLDGILMSTLLHGIRVLDFGRYIAGPYCGALLAEYGADVIRIEKRTGSEDRFPAQVGGGVGALFLQLNRNKRSVTLDPGSDAGRAVVRRLVRSADVVIANMPLATLKASGLDYDTLRSYRDDIIFVTNTAYGPVGPWSEQVGFDGVGQAMSGSVYMTGQPGEPYRAVVNWVDFGTALHCAFGTMAALMERQRSGRGQMVTGALLATALTFTNASLIEQAVTQVNRKPTGNRGQTSAPLDIYNAVDGPIQVAVTGNPLYRRWAKLMAQPGEAIDWLNDPRFENDDARGRHGEIISERMARWCAERSRDEIVQILAAAMIPCAPVLSPQEALDHPQVQALGLLQNTDYPGLPLPAPVAAVPLWMTETQAVPRRRAPLLGEHTDEVLIELGFGEAEIDALRRENVI
jgi:crotonobetainyl-CoA:carnitine CoA-transferase CaiB-like acyl-CoA transferase